MNPVSVPEAVRAMARRGPQWADWVETLPSTIALLAGRWQLCPDGEPTNGHCSLVLPVRTAEGTAAVLKIGFPEPESEHEHLALRRWGGRGAVRLLSAEPHRRALLLERLRRDDLSTVPDVRACELIADLYRRLHVPAIPALRPLSWFIDRRTAELAALPRSAPIPRRLVEQAIALGGELSSGGPLPERVIHTDLHYGNVLAGDREPWLAIDPKPVNGDPHYEVAPLLWNRWEEIAGDVRRGVRRRFWTVVDAAGFDEDWARGWVVVRMVHNAMWAVRDGAPADQVLLTRCFAVVKAVLS